MSRLASFERVCLFAHYDPGGRIDPYVIHYLTHLRRHGFGIVLISATILGTTDLARARELCDEVEHQPNGGLDFGSWAHGLRKYGSELKGDLLLANDSVYGPIGGLDAVMAKFAVSTADFFGAVESTEHAPHLQSWFLLFKAHVVRSAAFAEVFTQPFPSMTKRQIIRRGEVALSQALQRSGFTYEALFELRSVCSAPSICKINASVLLWRELSVQLGVPFIKVQVLRDNPLSETSVSDWQELVSRTDPKLEAIIAGHLARTERRTVPRGPVTVALVRWRSTFIRRRIREALASNTLVGIGPTIVFYALRQFGLALRRLMTSGRS